MIEESQTMDSAVINILDDPMALSIALRNQFDEVQSKNQELRKQEKEKLETELSTLGEPPHAAGDSIDPA